MQGPNLGVFELTVQLCFNFWPKAHGVLHKVAIMEEGVSSVDLINQSDLDGARALQGVRRGQPVDSREG